ncbi:MAG: hypothetical protein EBS76_04365 [Actinobacteria bacterium]|nr:hypothetical protein [Actinomycetota bacterium]
MSVEQTSMTMWLRVFLSAAVSLSSFVLGIFQIGPGSTESETVLAADEVWVQVGADIDGEAASDNSGQALALSSNGLRIAVGAEGNDGVNGTNSGHVRVFDLVNGAWVQKGSDLDGEAEGDGFGDSLDLSSDGRRLVVGANGNDGNGIDSGHVRVFEWVGTSVGGGPISWSWVQIGTDIDGEVAGDKSGSAVAISSDGSRVVVGAPTADGVSGTESGHVRVFDWDGSSWVQVGSDIDGESAGDRSGSAVAISSDGARIAVGAHNNDGSNGTNSGHVRVFDWDGSSWVQVGSDIDGEAAQDSSGSAIALSSNGSRIAVGAEFNDGGGSSSGHVRVFDWNGAAWAQVGADVDGQAGQRLGAELSLAIAGDGVRFAIGTGFADTLNGSMSGHVRVFDWDGSSWVQVGADIDGDAEFDFSGLATALSDDGSRVASGALSNDGANGANSGHARVFDLVSPASSSALSCSAWPGLIWVQNQGDVSASDYQAANTSQFFMFDPGSGDLDADGLNDASTWVYEDAVLGYDISINATGIDPTSNIMYGTAIIGDDRYVASFAPGEDPVFFSKERVRVDGSIISNIGNGFVDAEGYYWVKHSDGPLYRSQNPLSSYAGFANHTHVTDPMVFDAIGSGTFGYVSDFAVIPTADGYLVAGFLWNDLYWGTWNSATGVWTQGTNASVSTGTASPGDYGAVFVDGVTSDGGTLDYSGASIYFTPNAGWDPDNAAGRRPVKLAVADALDGITSDDLVLLESTPTPATSSNDGASMSGCGLQLPDPLGGLHGWMWADIDGDGSRTAVEPTAGMFGDEAAITGYTATVISETDWTTLQGVIAVPAGTRYPATVDADGKWSVDGLAAGADPTGVVQTFKVEFNYTDATMPTDFTPAGYTVEGGSTETDSDVPVTAGATATSIGGFTVVADTSTHAADAGLVAVPPVDPESQLDVTWRGECDASNDGTVNFWVDAFSNTSEYDATFELYVNDVLVETLVVQPGGQTAKVWETVIPYQASFRIDGTIEGETVTLETSGNGCEKLNTVFTEEEGGTDVDDLTCVDGGQFTVPAAPTREGFTFMGWNSAADGSGTEYVIGQTYDCADLVIYAVWTQNPTTTTTTVAPTTTTTVAPTTTTTVAPTTTTDPPPVSGLSFEPNGGSGEPGDITGSPGEVVTISSETPVRPDYVFQNWNTECDGSGVSHDAGSQITLLSSGTLELCAQWAPLLAATPGTESLASTGSEKIPPLSVSLFGMSIAAALYSVNQWRRLRLGVT